MKHMNRTTTTGITIAFVSTVIGLQFGCNATTETSQQVSGTSGQVIKSKSKQVSPYLAARNEDNVALGEAISRAKALGDTQKQILLYEDYLARYPKNSLVMADLAVVLAEDGQILRAKPYLTYALNPKPRDSTTAIRDCVLIYWYLKAGRTANDQATIDRAIELLKVMQCPDVLGDRLTFQDFIDTGVTVDALAKLYAGLSYSSYDRDIELGFRYMDEVGQEYANNFAICSVLAYTARKQADRWQYLKTTYLLAPEEYKQRLIANRGDLGWKIKNIRLELGEITEL